MARATGAASRASPLLVFEIFDRYRALSMACHVFKLLVVVGTRYGPPRAQISGHGMGCYCKFCFKNTTIKAFPSQVKLVLRLVYRV